MRKFGQSGSKCKLWEEMIMLAPEIQKLAYGDLSIPYVELRFEAIGEALPADHGYGLYSAIAHICPTVHDQDGISILTISGEPDRQGKIYLSKSSQLRIRLPYEPDKLAHILPLAGQTLKIANYSIQLNIPQIFPLRSYDKLRSRIVTIKKFQDPEPFLEAVSRWPQLNIR
jgi:CRISPR-associated protein Cas6